MLRDRDEVPIPALRRNPRLSVPVLQRERRAARKGAGHRRAEAVNEIDPTQPVYPLRRTKCYPVPPVCHAAWTAEDWERTAYYVTEKDVLEYPNMGRWVAVGRDHDGNLLYQQETSP